MNFQLNKISRGFTHSLKFEKHKSHPLLPKFVSIMESSECTIASWGLSQDLNWKIQRRSLRIYVFNLQPWWFYNSVKPDKVRRPRAWVQQNRDWCSILPPTGCMSLKQLLSLSKVPSGHQMGIGHSFAYLTWELGRPSGSSVQRLETSALHLVSVKWKMAISIFVSLLTPHICPLKNAGGRYCQGFFSFIKFIFTE